MTTLQIILIVIFLVSTVVGYFIIKNVPSLLHTPLMSGMNALSGITIIGALIAFAISFKESHPWAAIGLSGLAIIIATANVIGGFGITSRMLKLFKKEENEND